MDEDDLRMLRERIMHYRELAAEATDPMARILLEDLLKTFEEAERTERANVHVQKYTC